MCILTDGIGVDRGQMQVIKTTPCEKLIKSWERKSFFDVSGQEGRFTIEIRDYAVLKSCGKLVKLELYLFYLSREKFAKLGCKWNDEVLSQATQLECFYGLEKDIKWCRIVSLDDNCPEFTRLKRVLQYKTEGKIQDFLKHVVSLLIAILN